jgi:NADP-reducing hydrogenase subunit HndB
MNLEELKKIKEKLQNELKQREGKGKFKITVNMGSVGIASGAREVLQTFIQEIEKRQLKDVLISQAGDAGLEKFVPLVIVEETGKGKFVYGKVTPDIAKKIIENHILNSTPLTDYLIDEKIEN